MGSDLEELAKALQGETPATLPYDTHKELTNLSHSQLLQLRSYIPDEDQKTHNLVAPYEHQAFAREYTNENPVSGTLGLAAAIPAYQLAKLFGLAQGRSAPSMQEVKAGYQGIEQGLLQHMASN